MESSDLTGPPTAGGALSVSGGRKPQCRVKNMQQLIIESLLTKCKRGEESARGQDVEDDDSECPMVGYYATGVSEESRLVVCSPDLPITVASMHRQSPTSMKHPQHPQPMVPTVPSPVHQVLPHAQIAPQQQPPPLNHLPHQASLVTSAGAKRGSPAAPGATKEPVTTTTTDDPYQCNICSKTFAVPARLTRHYRTHTGEKPFQCEYCAKSFSVKENLSVHRRIHTKERPYKCEVCARAFEHSGKLHRHMRIHTGERPHRCAVCSKTFIQSGQLVIHMRTHTGEKPYVCNVCSKGFTCSKQLKVHSRTHTGEKPYACDICGKSFGYNHVLKLHQVAHYGEKVYKCTICNDTFNSKKCMEAHIKSHSEGNTSSASSTSSSASDKENTDSTAATTPPAVSYEDRYFSDYLQPVQYTQSGVELLAAAAAASVNEDNLASTEDVINLITSHNSRRLGTPPLALRHPTYFSAPVTYDAGLDHGNDIRRRVEAALAVASEGAPLLTPPSSNPVSPAPSSSPDPVEVVVKNEISLPPRKRSKMILKSMESEPDVTAVRYSSVIQYAKAS